MTTKKFEYPVGWEARANDVWRGQTDEQKDAAIHGDPERFWTAPTFPEPIVPASAWPVPTGDELRRIGLGKLAKDKPKRESIVDVRKQRDAAIARAEAAEAELARLKRKAA